MALEEMLMAFDRNYLLKNNKKISLFARGIAKFVDFFLVMILFFFLYPVGILLGLAYLTIADSIQGGQSVGKRLMGLKVISLLDGKPCTLKQSLVRNLPFIAPLTLMIIPFWGWIIGGILSVPFFLLEIYLLVKLESGNRLGDVMADTTVLAVNAEPIGVSQKSTSWFDANQDPSKP